MSDKPTKDHLTDEANKVRYKLLIDGSEDESVRRLLFSFKIVDPSTTKTYMCSDFPEDSEVQKVQMCNVTKCVLHVDMMYKLYYKYYIMLSIVDVSLLVACDGCDLYVDKYHCCYSAFNKERLHHCDDPNCKHSWEFL